MKPKGKEGSTQTLPGLTDTPHGDYGNPGGERAPRFQKDSVLVGVGDQGLFNDGDDGFARPDAST